MKRLIIYGDPGIRKGGIIRYDGEEQRLFSVTRNGDWHGPSAVQLWCLIGTDEETEAFERQDYIPHFLEVDRVDATEIDVIESKGELAI